MADLIDVFRRHAPADFRGADVSAALEELVARGAAAWPRIAIDPQAMVAQAARHLPPTIESAQVAADLAALHAADLHLACACAAGSKAALAAFERTALQSPALQSALSRIDATAAFADEVRQSVREKLLLSRAGAPPRIADYSGRWPLATWLRTIAVRAAVDVRRRGGAVNVPSPDARSAERLAAGETPELRYLKHRYGAAFREALGAAFATLDDEQANLLRLQLVDGLQTAQIAALFHVDRSTIKRRLARCRAQVLDGTRQRLREKLRLSPAEFESLAGLVESQLHLSLARLLKR
ncbi:MAG TPA: sigma-70 family RNA polymerase sigma factor [Myxococcales bacterium]|nr:sigma-70 family RNA polymerase sigma factor [Myxococcales bacterium]